MLTFPYRLNADKRFYMYIDLCETGFWRFLARQQLSHYSHSVMMSIPRVHRKYLFFLLLLITFSSFMVIRHIYRSGSDRVKKCACDSEPDRLEDVTDRSNKKISPLDRPQLPGSLREKTGQADGESVHTYSTILSAQLVSDNRSTEQVIEQGGIRKKTEMYRRTEMAKQLCQSEKVASYTQRYRSQFARKVLLINSGTNPFAMSYCRVFKAGSTELGRIVLLMNTLQNSSTEMHSKYSRIGKESRRNVNDVNSILEMKGSAIHVILKQFIQKFDPSSIQYPDGNNTVRFMVGRDPYSRLLSGYLDKVYLFKFPSLAEEIFNRRLDRHPITKPNSTVNCASANVTFSEFLLHLLDDANTGRHFNEHFHPYFWTCRPCDAQYHYMVKVENMNEDLQLILEVSKAPELLKRHVNLALKEEFESVRIKNTVRTSFLEKTLNCWTPLELSERLWKIFQIQGLLKDTEAFPRERFINVDNAEDAVDVFITSHRKHNISRELRQKLRRQGLIAAYNDVSLQTIQGVQMLFRMDFEMFGYDRVVNEGNFVTV